MLIGARGTGLHTQLSRLYSQYKIPVFELKKNLLSHLANEKEKVNRKLLNKKANILVIEEIRQKIR